MSDCTDCCGIGGWGGPQPGDPDNVVSLTATAIFGGVVVSWSMPMINPHAVAHVKIFRSTSDDFLTASEIATASGNKYFDQVTDPMLYFYWIQIVSIHGTEGEVIGPASVQSRSLVEQLIEELSGQIEDGLLATELREKVESIAVNRTELLGMIADRVAANAELLNMITELEQGLVDSIALATQETINRTDGDNALVTQLNLIAAANQDLATMLSTETMARVSEDGALSERIDTAMAAAEDAGAAVQEQMLARIGYSARPNGEPFDGDGVFVVYPPTVFPSTEYPEYEANRTRIIDSVGVDRWNAGNSFVPVQWLPGLPLATAVNNVSVINPSTGGSASIKEAFQAQQTLNGQFKGSYTVKLDVNGLVAGFGLYNTGATTEAGFSVDKFWVGSTDANKVKPFMIYGGRTYIDNAMIRQLTADKIDTRGLTIKDNEGNILFGAGSNLPHTLVEGLGSLATQNTVNANTQVSGLGGLATKNNVTVGSGDIVGLGPLATAADVRIGNQVKFPDGTTLEVGDFVNRLSRISATNISTYMQNAAIGSAYIGNAAIDTAHIRDLSVDTIKIANQAVNLFQSAVGSGNSVSFNFYIPAGEPIQVTILAIANVPGLNTVPFTLTLSAAGIVRQGIAWAGGSCIASLSGVVSPGTYNVSATCSLNPLEGGLYLQAHGLRK